MITESIRYVGVNDHEVDLFEGQFVVPNGMAYNSYVVLDRQTAVMDTVDARFAKEWLGKVAAALEGKAPDYLIVQHMEPDHSGSIAAFLEVYPETKVVASARAFVMMKNFFGLEFDGDRKKVVGDGDALCLGERTLHFVTAPMVHWPEVIMSYDDGERVLFSADAFGKFGALDVEEDWACEARRYYFGIVGKFGDQVQALFRKLAGFEIGIICALHGPVLRENLAYYLGLYQTWSGYRPEEEGVVIAYTSVYGNTRKAAEQLAELLRRKGCGNVVLQDLARCDIHEAVEDAFRYSKLVLATTTYNGELFPAMQEFIHHLTKRGFQKRSVGLVENGSWAPTAARQMRAQLEQGGKELHYLEPVVTITSALNGESSARLEQLAEALGRDAASETV